MDNPSFRLRIVFAKQGALRYLSHLEVSRAFERIIRRSCLPYKTSQGFNKHIKHAFGPALPVGTAGLREQLDVELTQYVPADAALARLRVAAPEDLLVLECKYVAHNSESLTKILTLASYSIELSVVGVSMSEIAARFEGLLDRGELVLIKKNKKKAYNLGQIIVAINVGDRQVDGAHDRDCSSEMVANLALTLRLLPSGSLRPEQIIAEALGDINYDIQSITRVALDVDNCLGSSDAY